MVCSWEVERGWVQLGGRVVLRARRLTAPQWWYR